MNKNMVIVLFMASLFLIVGRNSFASMCHGQGQKHNAQVVDATTHATPKKAEDIGNKVCPVMGEKIDEKTKVTYEYKGKIYNFCCAACIDEFKKDPQKYIEKVNGEINANSQQEAK